VGNGVVSKSQSHPTAYILVNVTLPYFLLDFNAFLENLLKFVLEEQVSINPL
jgi:hypothetical protein